MRRTHSLIHRGYLYAQKRVAEPAVKDGLTMGNLTTRRMIVAQAHKDGYLQARRDAKKT